MVFGVHCHMSVHDLQSSTIWTTTHPKHFVTILDIEQPNTPVCNVDTVDDVTSA